MESSSDPENVEGPLGIKWSQILTDSGMEVRLGGWGRLQIWRMYQGQWGQILTEIRMEVTLGGWSRHPMPKMLKAG